MTWLRAKTKKKAFTSTKYIIKVNHDTLYKDGFGNEMKNSKNILKAAERRAAFSCFTAV